MIHSGRRQTGAQCQIEVRSIIRSQIMFSREGFQDGIRPEILSLHVNGQGLQES